jgi:hypothetical protein
MRKSSIFFSKKYEKVGFKNTMQDLLYELLNAMVMDMPLTLQ